jgi:hypothetical protein
MTLPPPAAGPLSLAWRNKRSERAVHYSRCERRPDSEHGWGRLYGRPATMFPLTRSLRAHRTMDGAPAPSAIHRDRSRTPQTQSGTSADGPPSGRKRVAPYEPNLTAAPSRGRRGGALHLSAPLAVKREQLCRSVSAALPGYRRALARAVGPPHTRVGASGSETGVVPSARSRRGAAVRWQRHRTAPAADEGTQKTSRNAPATERPFSVSAAPRSVLCAHPSAAGGRHE